MNDNVFTICCSEAHDFHDSESGIPKIISQRIYAQAGGRLGLASYHFEDSGDGEEKRDADGKPLFAQGPYISYEKADWELDCGQSVIGMRKPFLDWSFKVDKVTRKDDNGDDMPW